MKKSKLNFFILLLISSIVGLFMIETAAYYFGIIAVYVFAIVAVSVVGLLLIIKQISDWHKSKYKRRQF